MAEEAVLLDFSEQLASVGCKEFGPMNVALSGCDEVVAEAGCRIAGTTSV